MRGNIRIREPRIPCNPPVCKAYYSQKKLTFLDGDLNKSFWDQGEWLTEFHDIEGDELPRPWKKTKVKVLWDQDALYIGAMLEDDTIWATVRNRDEVIFVDNDFEVFLAPQDSTRLYYEIELNALNTVWDLLMERPQRDLVRRIISWDVHGLESAVKIYGELNNPFADNRYWSVEIKLPWFSLRECPKDSCWPTHFTPFPGEIWRMDFSRVEYDVDIVDGKYQKKTDTDGRPLPEHNWLWAPTGVIDAHMPEMWGYLIFTKEGETYPLPEADGVKWILRKLYYREHAYACKQGTFCSDPVTLLGIEAEQNHVEIYVTPSMFEGIIRTNSEIWHIDQDGYVWKGDER